MRTPVLVAVTGLVALGAACGGSSDGQVIAGSPAAPTTAEITGNPGPTTTAPDTPPTTSLPPSSTTAEPSSTTTSTPPDGVIVDPEQYVTATARANLADFDDPVVLLPTWAPGWAAGTPPRVAAHPDVGIVLVQWQLALDHPYADEIGHDGTIILDLLRVNRTGDDGPLQGDPISGAARTYTLTAAATTCEDGDPVPAVLMWDDANYRYSVSMQPNPACHPDDFPVAQAVALADSLVPCDPTGPTLRCAISDAERH